MQNEMKIIAIAILLELFIPYHINGQNRIESLAQLGTLTPDSIEIWQSGNWVLIKNTFGNYFASVYNQLIFNESMNLDKSLSINVTHQDDYSYSYVYKLDSILIELGQIINGHLTGLHILYILEPEGLKQLVRVDTRFDKGVLEGTRINYTLNRVTGDWQVSDISFYQNGEEVFFSVNLVEGEIFGIYPTPYNGQSGWFGIFIPNGFVVQRFINGKLKTAKVFENGKLIQHNKLYSGVWFSVIKIFGKKTFQFKTPYMDQYGNPVWN